MAGLIQSIALLLTEQSKSQLAADMATAGAKGVAALRQEFNRKTGENRANLVQGIIDEKEFRAAAKRIADAFNVEIIRRMEVLRAAGRDTSKEYAELGRQIKLSSDTGIRSGGALTAAWGKVKTFATGMGAAIAAAFTVRAVVDFARESVNAAVAVGKSWLEIGNAVRSVGGDFVKMRPQIEDTVERISKSLAFDDEEIRDGLTRFIRATGSVDKGLRGVEVAAKLARAGNISVQQATDLLTRAMETGNTRGLTPFVGNLKNTGDVLGDVDRKLGDVASTVSPFQRGTLMLSEAWEDLHVAFGNVLISGAEGANVFDALQGVLKQFTTWVVENKDEIGRWVKGGLEVAVTVLKFLGKTVLDTGGQISDLAGFMKKVDVVVRTAWNGMVVAVASSVQRMLGVILKVQGAMLALSEALPGDPLAAQIRSAMQRTSGYIGDLGTFIADKSTEMKRDLGGDDASATKTDSLGGALAVNTEAGSKKAEGSIDRFTRGGKEKIKELSDSTKKHMEEMSEAYDAAGAAFDEGFTGPILQGKDAVLKAHKEMQKEQVQTTQELQQAQESIQSAYIKTGAAAEQSGGLIEQATRDAIAGKKAEAEEIERTRAASQNYAEEYWKRDVPLFLQGQSAQQEALHKTRDAGTEGAEKTKDSWLDALGVMNSAFQNLKGIFGGVLDGLVSGMGNIVAAASAIGSGIAGIGTKVGGLTGLLTKLAGGASLIGGIISAAGIAIDVINGLGDILGIKGSKDPGRFQTNRDAREFGARNPTGVFRDGLSAIDFLLLKSPTAQGGGGGWATTDAQENAWATLQALIRDLAAVNRLPAEYAYLVGGRTATAAPRPATPTNPISSTPWADLPATGQTNPWGIPGFQHGGWVRETGPALVHQGELVLPGTLAQHLMAVAGMQSAGRSSSESHVNTDNRSLHVAVYLTGVMDRDIPQRVVDAVSEAQGRAYQKNALLAGNARLD